MAMLRTRILYRGTFLSTTNRQREMSKALFKGLMIVDDSFSRLTTLMVVHDSFSVSFFGNHWPDSGLGRVVRKPVNANPGLNFNCSIIFSCLKMFFTSNV